MIADIEWSNVTHASAFLLGAILATAATLRIVRHISTMFGVIQRKQDDEDESA